MISSDYIEVLLSRIDIVDLISAAVPLKRAGKDLTAKCPFHNENTPSFTVAPAKQFYHCFGCGANGDAIGWVMNYGGMKFPEAVERLAASVGLPPPEKDGEEAARLLSLKPLKEVVSLLHRFYQSALLENKEALAYLESRGVSKSSAIQFGLGYAPDRYRVEGVRGSIAFAAGVARQDDAGAYRWLMRHRLIFPIRNSGGDVVAFGGRRMGKDGPKYLNSSDSPIYTKGVQLYGVGDIAPTAPKVMVHEGYMDSLVNNIHGIPSNAVCGTAMTSVQADQLISRHGELILMFDSDAPGLAATKKALEILLPKVRPRHTVKVARLPGGIDPDEYVLSAGPTEMERFRDEAPTAGEWVFGQLDSMSVDQAAAHIDWIKEIASRLTGSYADAFRSEMEKRGIRVVGRSASNGPVVRTAYHSMLLPMKLAAVILNHPDFARTASFSAALVPEPARTLARVIRQRPQSNAASIFAMLSPEWQKGLKPAMECQMPDLTDADVMGVYLEAALEEAKRKCIESPTDEAVQLCSVLESRLVALDSGEEGEEMVPDQELDAEGLSDDVEDTGQWLEA